MTLKVFDDPRLSTSFQVTDEQVRDWWDNWRNWASTEDAIIVISKVDTDAS